MPCPLFSATTQLKMLAVEPLWKRIPSLALPRITSFSRTPRPPSSSTVCPLVASPFR
jgi:hypothetical protein